MSQNRNNEEAHGEAKYKWTRKYEKNEMHFYLIKVHLSIAKAPILFTAASLDSIRIASCLCRPISRKDKSERLQSSYVRMEDKALPPNISQCGQSVKACLLVMGICGVVIPFLLQIRFSRYPRGHCQAETCNLHRQH